eukprot:tig00000403_g305.t1
MESGHGRGLAHRCKDCLRSLRKALARPAAFPQAAAELLATAFGAALVELHVVERGRLHGLLAAHSAVSATPRSSAGELASCLAAVLASPAPVSTGPACEGPRYAVRAADEEAAGDSARAVVTMAFEGGEAGLTAEEQALLVQAAGLVALGLQAHRSCPVEAVARAVLDPGSAFGQRGAGAAGRRPRGGGGSLGAAGGGVGELEAGRAVVRAGAGQEAPLLAQPIAVGQRLVGALVAAREGGAGRPAAGRAWSEEEAEAAACCAWTLGPALASEGAACARLAAAKAEIEAQNRALQRQLREQELIRRLANEINACSGVQAVFDCVAALLCGHFQATRAVVFDMSQSPRGAPRVTFAVPGSPHADADMSLSDSMVDTTIQLCEASPDYVFVRNGLDMLPPEFRTYTSALSCMCACTMHEGAYNALLIVETTDKIANWGPEESHFLRLVADQIGIALAQSALREQVAVQNRDLQRELRNSALLAGIVREISQEVDGSIEHIFHRSAELVGKAFNVDRCSLWQYFDNTYKDTFTEAQVVWVAKEGIPKALPGYDAQASSVWWALHENAPDGVLHIPDVQAMARASFVSEEARREMEEVASRSSMATRVFFRGQIQGVIVLEMVEREASWGAEERLLLKQVAEHVGVAIAHGRLLEQQRTHAAQLERQLMHSGLLEAMTREIHQVLGVREVYQRSARLVREAFRACRVRVLSLDDPALEAIDAAPGVPDAALLAGPDIHRAVAASVPEAAPEWPATGSFFEPLVAHLTKSARPRPSSREEPSPSPPPSPESSHAYGPLSSLLAAGLRRLGGGGAAAGKRVIALEDATDAAALGREGISNAHFFCKVFGYQQIKSIAIAFTTFHGRPNALISVSQIERARAWQEDELRLLHTVSEQIGVAIMQSVLLRNETEQRELLARQNAALEEARREADAASAAKSQFLAMVSHEIRTPMNALCNMSELLLDTELSPQQRDFCTIIHNSSLALLNILKDILDTSRLEFNKVEIRRAPVVLREIFEQATELMFPSAAQKGIDLTWHVARDCPALLHTDGARLNQILVNTLGNGIKFTSRGEVSLTARMEGEQLCIMIRDTGIGIAEEDQQKLFSWFYQVDSSHSRQYGGTGLGLFISRKLAVLLGGDMRCESERGRGSTFFVTFPARAITDGAAALALPPPISDEVGWPLSGRRVAVWSPSPATRALLREALEDAGAAVDALPPPDAPDSDSDPGGGGGCDGALDCCILDTAPPASGVGFAGSSPAWRRLADVPRVALVARGMADHDAILQACAEAVLKPAKPRAVVEAVFAAIAAPLPSPGAARRLSSDLRILVAEDVEVNTKILLLMLKKRGYTRVQAVSNGAEALAAVHAAAAAGRQFHCLLLDVMMPVMDGLTAARRIKAELPEARRPYIIALTANAMAGDREHCLASGMSDYLPKPVRMDALVAALQRCEALGRRRASGSDEDGSPKSEPAPEPAGRSTSS